MIAILFGAYVVAGIVFFLKKSTGTIFTVLFLPFSILHALITNHDNRRPTAIFLLVIFTFFVSVMYKLFG